MRPPKTQPASMMQLSPQTDCFITGRGSVVFVRGQQAFRLTDREAMLFAELFKTTTRKGGTPDGP